MERANEVALEAAGWANGRAALAHLALARWQALACRIDGPDGVSEPWWAGDEACQEMRAAHAALGDAIAGLRSAAQVRDWARCVLALAGEWESNPPVAWCDSGAGYGGEGGDSGVATLHWQGTFTAGRCFTVSVWDTSEGLCARIEWQSGTGKPSRFLGIGALLREAQEDLTDWGEMEGIEVG